MQVTMSMEEYKRLEEYRNKYNSLSKAIRLNYTDIETKAIDNNKLIVINIKEILNVLDAKGPKELSLIPDKVYIGINMSREDCQHCEGEPI